MDRVFRLHECVELIVNAAAPRVARDDLDAYSMIASRAELRRLSLVSAVFRDCAQRAMATNHVLLRTVKDVEALDGAIALGYVGAARITHVTLAPIVRAGDVEGAMHDELWKMLDDLPATVSWADHELERLHMSMLRGIDEFVDNGGGSAMSYRPFCQAFGELRARLTHLRWVQTDGLRAVARAPDAPLWRLPEEVVLVYPPEGGTRQEYEFDETPGGDRVRMAALLEHSAGTRLHVQILGGPEEELNVLRPLWTHVHTLTLGSSRHRFGGQALRRWLSGDDELFRLPALRRLRLYMSDSGDTLDVLDDLAALEPVEELLVNFRLLTELPADCQPAGRDHWPDLALRNLQPMRKLRSLTLSFTDFPIPSPIFVPDDAYLTASMCDAPSFPALKSLHVNIIQFGPEVRHFDEFSNLRSECELRGIDLRVTGEWRYATRRAPSCCATR